MYLGPEKRERIAIGIREQVGNEQLLLLDLVQKRSRKVELPKCALSRDYK